MLFKKFNNIIYSIFLILKNIPGPRVNGRYVIIECDDFGGIRMPSKEVYEKLLKFGIPVDKGWYDKYDTMAGRKDLYELFEVLHSVKDKKGNPAVITPVVNVANPDFKKIKDSDFTQYYYESFKDTLERYFPGSNVFNAWEEGMKMGIFVPEYHGREHISVQPWLQKLHMGDKKLRYAFDHEYVSVLSLSEHPAIDGFRAEFYFNENTQIPFLEKSIHDGLKLFCGVFGYVPRSFTPSNGIFHPRFEKLFAEGGVKYLNTNYFNLIPDEQGNLRRKFYCIGKTTSCGLTYYTRNCAFEPSDPKYRGVGQTLKQIEAAFALGKPAIISTHRINFVGGIYPANRDNGLKELRFLLLSILRKWPDAVFMSSGEFINLSLSPKG